MPIRFPARHETGVHELVSGLSMEWLREGRIVAFTWRSVAREAVDAHAEVYGAVVRAWNTGEPFAELNDLAFPGFSLTPYLRRSVLDGVRLGKELGIKGRVANVMMPGIIMRIVQFFLTLDVIAPGTQTQIFADREKAIAWLDQSVQPQANPPASTDSKPGATQP